jgi:8-amino-7-oxononanoate synthase
VLRDEPHRQQRVRALAKGLRSKLIAMGYELPAGDSPIVPVILGGETQSLTAAERLREAGFLVVAIRPPTVSRGGSRLRITLSSEHRDEEVHSLLDAMHALRSTL